MTEQTKITSFNVRGICDNVKRNDVFDYLKSLKSDIYCIQDIHCTEEQEMQFKRDWKGDIYISCGTNRSRGVAILFGGTLEYETIDVKKDNAGNYIILNIKIIDMEVCLVNIYGPNTDSPQFYTEVFDIITEMNTQSVIMCGDWNLVQDQNLDTKYYLNENNVRAKETVLLHKEQLQLEDPWRITYPSKMAFTWFQKNPIKMSRLDFFLVSSDIMNLLSDITIKPGYRSDHSFVSLSLKCSEGIRGKGFWKFNISLLENNDYHKLIESVIKENIQFYSCPNQEWNDPEVKFTISDQLFYETLKMEIRKASISFSAKLKRDNESLENYLRNQLNSIHEETLIDAQTMDRKEILEGQLEMLRLNKVKGMIIRSKIQWSEEGDKPTKFFA